MFPQQGGRLCGPGPELLLARGDEANPHLTLCAGFAAIRN